MALIRREPLTTELPTLFNRALLGWPGWLGEQLGTVLEAEHIPVEEFDEDGKHVVRAELPGIDPDQDVDVSVRDGVLRIRAERRREERTERPHFYREEIRYGAFARNIMLPAGCDESDVTAEYADGVLTVRLPLGAERPASKIPVTRTDS
jgi:HSP20 family protein